MKPEMDTGVTTCSNCHAPMPKELRFCRNCGFRLGEGTAEYTETVRFQNAPPGTLPVNGPASAGAYGFAGPMTVVPRGKLDKRRGRMSGTSWMFVGLLIFFIAAAGFTAIVRQVRSNIPRRGVVTITAPRSWAGVNSFDTTDGGVTFDNIEPPGGPADKAGLVGGDIITTIDGKQVHSDDEMMDLLRRIPIGKTVDLVYLRDGEIKNTKMTTVSEEEMDRLKEVFTARPEGRGLFGYEEGDSKRVEIPNTKMFGVQLDRLSPNRSADLAGIKQGDIVIQWDDIPIRTPEEFLSRVRRAIPYSTVKVLVIRNGERIVIPVKMGKA